MTKNFAWLSNISGASYKCLAFLCCVVGLLGSVQAASEQWQPVIGDEISALLSGQHVVYEGESVISQTFHEGGSTTYVDGRPSLGRWRASETQYCSSWPPSDYWECYDLFKDSTGKRIRFTSSVGQEWIARFDNQ